MLRRISLILVLTFSVSVGYSYFFQHEETVTIPTEDILSEINVDNIYADIEQLSKQPREAGTESELEAVHYIKKQFEALGYDTKLQTFPLIVYKDPELTELKVLGNKIPNKAFEYSEDLDVEAELVPVGKATKQELLEIDLSGKIALVERGDIPLYEKIINAQKKGAIAVIMYNNEGDKELFDGFQHPSLNLPTLAISRQDGQAIMKEIEEKRLDKALIQIKGAKIEQSFSHNVIATKKPARSTSTQEEEDFPIISVGAHHDSVKLAPGANDDASGTAVVLELARVLANKPIEAELRFITFGAEERGLIGSYFYTKQLSESEINRSLGHFQLDMVGSKDAGDLIMYTVNGEKNRVTDMAANASAFLSEALPYGKMGRSDHVPFHDIGIPSALFIHAPVEPWYHTEADTLDKISKEKLHEVANIIGTSLYKLALHPDEAKSVCYDEKRKQLVVLEKKKQKKSCIVDYPFESRELD